MTQMSSKCKQMFETNVLFFVLWHKKSTEPNGFSALATHSLAVLFCQFKLPYCRPLNVRRYTIGIHRHRHWHIHHIKFIDSLHA